MKVKEPRADRDDKGKRTKEQTGIIEIKNQERTGRMKVKEPKASRDMEMEVQ